MSLRVVVVDDRAVPRGGLRVILAESGRFGAVVEVDDLARLPEALAVSPDVLVVAIEMLDPPPAALRQTAGPASPAVVAYGTSRNAAQVRACVALGVETCIPLDAAAPDVVDLVAAAARPGGRNVEGPKSPVRSQGKATYGLTRRELSVVCLLVKGRAPSQIAVEMNLAPTTISTFLRRIKNRLAVETNAELAAFAVIAGLCLPEGSSAPREGASRARRTGRTGRA